MFELTGWRKESPAVQGLLEPSAAGTCWAGVAEYAGEDNGPPGTVALTKSKSLQKHFPTVEKWDLSRSAENGRAKCERALNNTTSGRCASVRISP